MMRRPILWIVLAAIALRLLFALGFIRGWQGVRPEEEITDGYEQIAENLHAGLGYRQFAAHPPTLERPPGYPYFLLAIFQLFGVRYAVVQVVHAVLGGLSCWLLYLLGRWVLNARLGLWAAALGAIHLTSIEYASRLYAENLYFPLFLGTAYLLCRAVTEGSRGYGFASGLLYGLGLLTRGTLLAAPPFLAGALLLHPRARVGWRRWPRWLLPAALGAILALSPWVVRNARLTGAFIPVSAWGWAPFYHGIRCSQEMLRWGDLRAVDLQASQERHQRVLDRLYQGDSGRAYASPREYLRHEAVARDLVWEEIRGDAAGYLLRGIAGIPFGWFQTLSPQKRLLSLCLHLPLLALFVLGAVRMARDDPASFARAWPAFGLIAFVTLFQAFVFPFARYLAPAVALSFLYSGYAGLRLTRRIHPCA